MEHRAIPIERPIVKDSTMPLEGPRMPYDSFLDEKGSSTSEWINDGETEAKEKQQIRKGVDGDFELQREGVLPLEHPSFWAVCDALGLNRNTATQDVHDITDITNLAVRVLGFNDPTILFKFISHQATVSGKNYRALKIRLSDMLGGEY